MSNDEQTQNIVKSQITLTFAKGKLKVVQTETERLGDDTQNILKINSNYDATGDKERVLMMKKAVLRTVAQFLGNQGGALNAELEDSEVEFED